MRKSSGRRTGAASTAFFTALAFGLGITVLGTLFLDPLMRVLGATPTILPYARDYARYILFGAPVMCASFVLNNILRGEGKAMLAMVGIGLGGVLNHRAGPAVHLYVRAWHRRARPLPRCSASASASPFF